MRDGRLLAMDSPGNLKKQFVPGAVWEVYASPLDGALAALRKGRGILRVGLAGDHIRAITEPTLKQGALKAMLVDAGMAVSGITAGEITLEDVFLSVAR